MSPDQHLELLQQTPHRRWNPLTGEWVLVSPQRTLRPWQGKIEAPPANERPAYDPTCYLCPGNARANGAVNPRYTSTFTFDNDFSALVPHATPLTLDRSDLLVARSGQGICRVGCFSPRHDLTIPLMSLAELRLVVDMWTEQFVQLDAISWVRHVQIFENRGEMMGASNPHPHCQIWATAELPNQALLEQRAFEEYGKKHNTCLLCEYLRLEREEAERVVCENDRFAAIVPFWAVWPFETLLISKRHIGSMQDLEDSERDLLADILKQITTRYDNLFEVSFPYSMGFHQRPTDEAPQPEWHLHAHYYPPLLRSATIRKFMVGYEMLGTPQRDITPEAAAERLRSLSAIHYLDRP
jgi:UDPglucose--hexose-1-phosphate uridylyltransferase